MSWKTLLIIVGGIWLAGWLLASVIYFLKIASLKRRAGESVSRDAKSVAGCSVAMSWFVWPFILRDAWEEWEPRLAVRFGFRPSWILAAEGEEASHTWNLSDGTEFFGCVLDLDTADISAHGEIDDVAYRLRKIAPEETPPTEWRQMRRLSWKEMEEYGEADEEDEDDDDRKPAFTAKPRLEPGKYRVEFRIRLPSGEVEELSALTLIVT